MVRHPGIEPGASAWEAPMLPLHQWRSCCEDNRRDSLIRRPNQRPFEWKEHQTVCHSDLSCLTLNSKQLSRFQFSHLLTCLELYEGVFSLDL